MKLTTKDERKKMIDYKVEKVKKVETKWIKPKDLPSTYGLNPIRSMITKEEELKQINQLEDMFGFELNNTKETIDWLDVISPDRIHNVDFMCWKGFNYTNVRNPVFQISDVLHIISNYFPSMIGLDNFQIVPRTQMKVRNQLKKMRTENKFEMDGNIKRTNPYQTFEIKIWEDIIKVSKPIFLYTVPNPFFMDMIFTLTEISNFYLTVISGQKNLKKVEEDKSDGNFDRLLKVCTLTSFYDVFPPEKLKFVNQKSWIFPKLNKDDLELLNKNKFLFSSMVTSLDKENN